MNSAIVTSHKRRPVLRAVCRVASAICWTLALLALVLCAPFFLFGAVAKYLDLKVGRL